MLYYTILYCTILLHTIVYYDRLLASGLSRGDDAARLSGEPRRADRRQHDEQVL